MPEGTWRVSSICAPARGPQRTGKCLSPPSRHSRSLGCLGRGHLLKNAVTSLRFGKAGTSRKRSAAWRGQNCPQLRKVRIEQQIILTAGSARIDFPTEVEWKESQKLLKVAFPVDVHAQKATYEIQFGHLERPTHANTSWDMGKFEVCAQSGSISLRRDTGWHSSMIASMDTIFREMSCA